MGVSRLDTGSDGKSYIEACSAEVLRELKVVGTMRFRVQERPPGFFMDVHPAPCRRWQVDLGVGRAAGSPMGQPTPLSLATSG